MGALANINVIRRTIFGNKRILTVNFNLSGSYEATGDTGLTAAALGLDNVELVLFSQPGGLQLEYNYTNGRVLAYRIEVIAAAIVSDGNNSVVKSAADTLEVAGAGTRFGFALPEVFATTSLSAIQSAGNVNEEGAGSATIRCIVFGF